MSNLTFGAKGAKNNSTANKTRIFSLESLVASIDEKILDASESGNYEVDVFVSHFPKETVAKAKKILDKAKYKTSFSETGSFLQIDWSKA